MLEHLDADSAIKGIVRRIDIAFIWIDSERFEPFAPRIRQRNRSDISADVTFDSVCQLALIGVAQAAAVVQHSSPSNQRTQNLTKAPVVPLGAYVQAAGPVLIIKAFRVHLLSLPGFGNPGPIDQLD